MQNFFGAYFGKGKVFPKFRGCFNVLLGDFVLLGHEYCMFECNCEMFLKVMKGGRIHFGLCPEFRVAFLLLRVRIFLFGLFVHDGRVIILEFDQRLRDELFILG